MIKKKVGERAVPVEKEEIELKLTGPDGEVKEVQKIVKDRRGRIVQNTHIIHRRKA